MQNDSVSIVGFVFIVEWEYPDSLCMMWGNGEEIFLFFLFN